MSGYYPCRYCRSYFQSERQRRMHERGVHGVNSSTFTTR